MSNPQLVAWAGEFGRDYTDRNPQSVKEMESLYRDRFGIPRSELNRLFLREVDEDASILEVGTNVGNQLACLSKLGYTNLHGIEIQRYAIDLAHEQDRDLHLVQASASDLPFPDEAFDLVFTSGVLIHMSPEDLEEVLDEIRRCSRRWIWGFEYYSDSHEKVQYRGRDDLLWKANFAELYRERDPSLTLVKEVRLRYRENDNVDQMFLLRQE